MSEYRQRITKEFVERINHLIESGAVSDFAEIIYKLNWNKSSMSSVMSGARLVPIEVYHKFSEVYGMQTTNEKKLIKPDAIISPTLENLSESNKILARANETLADAHKIIAKNNDELIQMAKTVIERAVVQTPKDEPAKVRDLLEAVADYGVQHKFWKSKEEASLTLNKVAASVLMFDSKVGIPAG